MLLSELSVFKINICRVHKCIAKTVRRYVMKEAKDLIWRVLLAQHELRGTRKHADYYATVACICCVRNKVGAKRRSPRTLCVHLLS